MKTLIKNQYEILQTIGTGEISIVHLAMDRKTNKKVAIKELKSIIYENSAESIIRFKREADIVSKISHPGIIKIIELFEEGNFFLVMEYFKGKNLKQSLNDFSLLEKIGIIKDAAGTLSYIHNNNIIHRDIKPENILVNRNGRIDHRIIDFGLAYLVDIFNPFNDPQDSGTLSYISPEQTGLLRRPIDSRSDLYSLGITFFELLTGNPPFIDDDIGKLIYKHLATKPIKPSLMVQAIPPVIDDIVLKLLNKEPSERYQTAEGLRDDLDIFLKSPNKKSFTIAQTDRTGKLNLQIKAVGRDSELAILKQKFLQVSKNQPCTVLIKGVAGLGKSKLVETFKEESIDENTILYSYKCSNTTKNYPYAPFLEMLKGFLESQYYKNLSNTALMVIINDFIGTLTELLPNLSISQNILPTINSENINKIEDNKIKKEMLIKKVTDFINSAGSIKRKIIIFIDDIQWADTDSLDLINYLSRNIHDTKVFLILNIRLEEADENYINTFLKDNTNLITIDLTSLTIEYVPLFINSILNNRVTFKMDFYEKIYQISIGNPLFLLEAVKELYNSKIISFRNNEWIIDYGSFKKFHFETDVTKLLLKKISLFKEEEKRVLSIASVIGKEFNLTLLSAILDPSNKISNENIEVLQKIPHGLEDIINIIDKAKREHLVEENISRGRGIYSFSHDKIIETLYGNLDNNFKTAIHLICAKALEGLYKNNIDEVIFHIAYHYNKTDNAHKMLFYNDLAYQKALSSYSYSPAVYYMKNIADYHIKHNSVDKDIVKLIIELCKIFQIIGEIPDSLNYLNHTLETADNLHLQKEKMDIYFVMGSGYQFLNNPDEALKYYRQALEIAEKIGVEIKESKPYNLIGYSYFFNFELRKAKDYITKAIEFTDKNDLENLLLLYLTKIYTSGFLGEVKESQNDIKFVGSNIDKVQNPLILSRLYHGQALSFVWNGQCEKALEYSIKAYNYAKKIDYALFQFSSLFSRMAASFSLNKFKDTKEIFEEAIKMSEEKKIYIIIESYWSYMGLAYITIKDLTKANEHIEKYLQDRHKMNNKFAVLLILYIRAAYLYYLGDINESLKILDEAYKLYKEREFNLHGVYPLLLLSNVLKNSGKNSEAELYQLEAYDLLKNGKTTEFVFQNASYLIECIEEARQIKMETVKESETITYTNFIKEKIQLSNIIKTSQLISSILDITELIEAVLEKVIEVTGAERGILLLLDKPFSSRRYIVKNIEVSDKSFKIIELIFNRTEKTKESLVLNRTTETDDILMQEINFHKIRSILCTPLILKGEMIGVLYLDSKLVDNLFSEDDLNLLEVFTSQVAISMDNAKAYQELEQEKKHLDQRVKERTEELHVAYQQIQNEKKIIEQQNEKIKQELALAKKIQLGLMPVSLPVIEGVTLSRFYKPMEDVGGDFYDFINLSDPPMLGIFISDVSGHGVPASLITSMIKTLIETSGANKISPKSLLTYINENIIGQTSGNFLTAFYGLYKPETKIFSFARAAHNYPVLIRKNKLIELESKGRVLGVFNNISFEESEIQLEAGDKILFYTDGLTEAVNLHGQEFEEKLYQLLIKNCNIAIDELIHLIYHELLKHRGTNIFDDDVCMVGMEIK